MKLLFWILAIAVALATAGCGTQAYAAKVDGEVISRDQLFDQLRVLAAGRGGAQVQGDMPDSFDAQVTAQVLQSQIFGTIAQQQVERRGLRVDLEGTRSQIMQSQSAQVFNSLPEQMQQEELARQAAILALQDDLLAAGVEEPDEEAVAKAYEDDPEQFRQVCVRAFATLEPAEATAARDRIVAGEPFEAVAAAVSPGAPPGTAGTVQCLPTQALQQQAPELAAALEAATPGSLLEPVTTDQGVIVVEYVEAREPSLDVARAFVAEQIANNPQFGLQFALTRILDETEVEVNPQFGEWTGQELVPPSGPESTGEEELPGATPMRTPFSPGDVQVPGTGQE